MAKGHDPDVAQGKEPGRPDGADGDSSESPPPDAPPTTGEANARQDSTMQYWYKETRRSRAGNQIAATRYQVWGRFLATVSAALTAFVGGSLFTSWSAEETSGAMKIFTGTISVTAAVLVVVIATLGFSGKALSHQQASVTFGVIVHDLETLHAADHAKDGWAEELERVKKALNDAAEASPILPRRFFNAGQRWVEKHPRTLPGSPPEPTPPEATPGLLRRLLRALRPKH